MLHLMYNQCGLSKYNYNVLCNSPALNIISLLLRLAHREGLSWQHATGGDGGEEGVFVERAKKNGDGLFVFGQLFDAGLAVDVVDVAAFMGLQVFVQKFLEQVDWQAAVQAIDGI